MNLNLSINKAFKDQVKLCIETTFVTTTQQKSSKILSKKKTRVLELVMFYDARKKQRKYSKC